MHIYTPKYTTHTYLNGQKVNKKMFNIINL